MLEWVVERIQALVNAVPALLVSEDFPNLMLGRTMIRLLLIIFVVYLIIMRPFRSSMPRQVDRLCHAPQA
jgi:hypothetical protein